MNILEGKRCHIRLFVLLVYYFFILQNSLITSPNFDVDNNVGQIVVCARPKMIGIKMAQNFLLKCWPNNNVTKYRYILLKYYCRYKETKEKYRYMIHREITYIGTMRIFFIISEMGYGKFAIFGT